MGIRLDELVLQNCVKHMDIISRMTQDLVSRNFASVLRLYNSTSEISWNIRQEEIVSATKICQQLCISINANSKSIKWKVIVPNSMPPDQPLPMQKLNTHYLNKQRTKPSTTFLRRKLQKIRLYLTPPSAHSSMKDEIATTMHDIRRILQQIIFRFKRFKRITLLPTHAWVRYAVDFLLELFSLQWYQPTSVKQIVYEPGGYWDPLIKTFAISRRDCRLVEVFATSLEKYMLLDGELPQEGTDLSKRFWAAISACSSMKKLYLCRTCEAPKLLLNNTEVRNCLQSSKISEFHSYDNNDGNLVAEWFVQSFSSNMNLQKLYINPYSSAALNGILATPSVLDIISRLRSVEIAASTHDFDDSSTIISIRKIFRALGERGYANIEYLICVHHETKQKAIDAHTVEALAFWIRLSDETQKPIRLCARSYNYEEMTTKTKEISRKAIDELSKLDEFPGIEIEHRITCSIVQFNHARIAIYFKLLTWKPYLTVEYVCKRGHHVG